MRVTKLGQPRSTIHFVAGDSVTFRLDGEVEIGKLSVAFARFTAVLEQLPRTHDARVRWVLAGLDFGSAVATARAVPIDDHDAQFVPLIVDEFLAAAESVRQGAPDDLNRPLLRLVRELVEIADDANPITLETAADEVMFVAPVVPIGGDAHPLPSTVKSLGTVRGRVETLLHRGGLRFSLFELVTDRAVSCYLPDDHENLMRDAWGHVADVTGTVTRDVATGRPLAIRRVTSVEVVPEGSETGYLEARGAIAGTEPAENVVRRIRDAS